MAATAHLTLVAPDNEKFTVRSAPARLPRRKPNAEYRSREHLTERGVGKLIEAMKGKRYEDPPSHAAPRLRLQVGQRRRRYQNNPGPSRPQIDPAYGALHRAGTDSVQKLIPGLTAPAASFEATVGGSGCPRLVEFFKKISMNARWVPFCVEVPAA